MEAIIFVPALAASAVFGFIFALFAAHYYLTVLQGTGSGARHVAWGCDPILDSFWKVFYLGWLVVLWLGPALILTRAVVKGTDSDWLRLAVPLAFFWACFPISQLSSLSGPTIWLPLHPDVFFRILKKPGVVLGFMALSGLSLVGIGLGFHWTFFASGALWLVVGCPLFVLSGLLYARILGRLAFVLSFTKPFLFRKKRKAADAMPEPTHFPMAVPPTDDDGLQPITPTPKERKRIVAEAVVEVKPRPPRGSHSQGVDPQRRWTEDDEDRTPYGVSEPVLVPEDNKPIHVIKPSAEEMRLISRDDVPRKPKKAWTAEVFALFEQQETWSAVLILSGWCFLFGGFVRIARTFNPVAGGS